MFRDRGRVVFGTFAIAAGFAQSRISAPNWRRSLPPCDFVAVRAARDVAADAVVAGEGASMFERNRPGDRGRVALMLPSLHEIRDQ